MAERKASRIVGDGVRSRARGHERTRSLASVLLIIVALSMAAAGLGQAEPPVEQVRAKALFSPGLVTPRHDHGERWPAKTSSTVEQRIRALIPDADRNCLGIGDQPETPAQIGLVKAVQDIRRSALGAWLVRTAAARDVTLCIDHATPLEAHYRAHLRLLALNARLDVDGRVVFLAHELAHVPQHPRFSNNRHFSPVDMIMLQRMREATAEAIATRVLWQLRERGLASPWQNKLKTAYHDIAETFEATIIDGAGPQVETKATRAAFLRWFEADWRRDIYDDLMLNTLARIADDAVGLIPTSRHLSASYLHGMSRYGGETFLSEGDSLALIDRFQLKNLHANSRAKLHAILARTDRHGSEQAAIITDETSSAIGPTPTADAGPGDASIR